MTINNIFSKQFLVDTKIVQFLESRIAFKLSIIIFHNFWI